MLHNGHKNTGGRLVLWSSAIVLVSWVCFWAPSVAVHWARGQAFGAIEVVLLSMAMPAIAVALSRSLPNLGPTITARCLLPLFMLGALWIGGPAAMMLSASATGGGLAQQMGWKALIEMTLVFPFSTLVWSVYDGSAVGLLIATLVLIVTVIVRMMSSPASGIQAATKGS
jgi:hypothetical protein